MLTAVETSLQAVPLAGTTVESHQVRDGSCVPCADVALQTLAGALVALRETACAAGHMVECDGAAAGACAGTRCATLDVCCEQG